MASKYIVAINKKHLFNPVAFAVAVTALTINQTASWWVGNAPMLPFVLIGGLLVVRKIRRFDLVLSFFFAALVTHRWSSRCSAAATSVAALQNVAALFAAVLLRLRHPHRAADHAADAQAANRSTACWSGFLFAPQFHIAAFYITPEMAHPDRQRVLVPRQPQDQADPARCKREAAACARRVRVRLRAAAALRLRARSVHGMDARSRRPGHARQPPLLHDCLRADRATTCASASSSTRIRARTSSRCWRWTPTTKSWRRSLRAISRCRTTAPEMRLHRRGDRHHAVPQHDQVSARHAPAPPDHGVLLQQDGQGHRLQGRARSGAARTGHQGWSTRSPTRVNFPASWRGKVGRINAAMIRAGSAGLHALHLLHFGTRRDGRRRCSDLLHGMGIPATHIKTDFFSGLA